MDRRRELGAEGEALAARYLERRGWRIIERNWRCREGEIDLVCRDADGVAVVCEVRTRSGQGYGSPLESVTHAKVRRLRRLAAAWAHAQAEPVGALRVDVLGILMHPDGTASVEHVRGIEP